jgi:hypothetical protein
MKERRKVADDMEDLLVAMDQAQIQLDFSIFGGLSGVHPWNRVLSIGADWPGKRSLFRNRLVLVHGQKFFEQACGVTTVISG